jgi:uncharacterized repeat protein (TIGR01451 family)
VTLAGGDVAICTVTNDDIAPAVTIRKELVAETGPTPQVPDEGETLTYEIILTNTGGPAHDFSVTDILDAKVTFDEASHGGLWSGGEVTWSNLGINGMVAGVPGELVLQVKVTVNTGIGGGAIITNIAKKTGTIDPPCPSDQCVVIPNPPRVTLDKKLVSESGGAIAGTAEPGERLTYRITLTNTGTATSYDVTDKLDPNTSFVSASGAGAYAGGVVTWTAIPVPAESGGTPGVIVLEVVVDVNTPLPMGTSKVSNMAFRTGDPEPLCPSAQCVQMPTLPVISVAKTLVSENGSIPNMAEPGETLVYAITLTNTGGPETNFALTDVLDPNVTLLSASDAAVVNGAELNWTGLSVPAQTTIPGVRVLNVHVRVNSPLPAGVAGIANIAVRTGDAPPACPSAQCVHLPTPPAVTIKKELTGENGMLPGVAEPGEVLTYQITLTNTGGPANGYAITDKLDSNIVAATADNAGVVGPTSIEWTNLAVPQQVGATPGQLVLTVTTTVADPIPSGVSRIANLVYEPGQPEPVCPAAQCASLPTVPAISISKELTGESGTRPGIAEPGEVLTYKITLTNTGGPATGYQVTDRLDANVSFLNASDGGVLSGLDIGWTGLEVPAQIGATPGSKSLTVRTRVKDPLPAGAGTVANIAFRTGATVPTCPDPACVQITTPPQVAVKKELTGESIDRNSIAQPGEVLDYTITLTNGGGTDFAGYRITENVPAGAVLSAVSGATGFVGPVTGPAAVALVVPTIPAGTNVLVTVSFTLSDPLPAGATAIVNALSGPDLPPDCLTCSVTTPTPALITVTKDLGGENIVSDGVAQPGERLTYAITLANSGGTAFSNFRFTEQIPMGATLTSVLGAAGWTVPVAGPATLDLTVGSIPADSSTLVIVTFVVDDPIPSGLNAIGNTVSGGDIPPGCAQCTVTVPTTSNITVDKALTDEDGARDGVAQPGETLTYTITLTNSGGATFANFQFSENVPAGVTLTAVNGADGFVSAVKGPAIVDLQRAAVPAGVSQVSVEFLVDNPIAEGLTTITNLISGGNIDPACTTCAVAVPTASKVGVLKELSGESKTANTIAEPREVLTYRVTLTNSGGSDFNNFRFTENVPVGASLTAVSGATGFVAPVVGPGTLDLVVPTIAADNMASVTVEFTMDDPLPSGVATLANIVSGGDIAPGCSSCSVILPLAVPSLSVDKTGAYIDADGSGGPTPGDTLTYQFAVTNTGNVQLDDVAPIDPGPRFNGRPATASLSAITPAPLTLVPAETRIFTATYVLSQDDIDNAAGIADGVANTASARGYRDGLIVPANAVDAADSLWLLALPAVGPSNIVVAKQAGLRFIRIGESVAYTITVTNNAQARASGLRITDIAPSGFRYVKGSALVNGAAVTPLLAGREIIFDNLTVEGHQTLEVRLELVALSSAGPGRHVNTAIAADADGKVLAPEANAAVEIIAEPIFDCSEIIGRVFDDKNRNGYQDEGEPGLPGARLATVSGLLVTTDSHGRFHLPCAAMPDQRIGANFIMKLDVRTLPTGYSVTTENPRVVRLTAGKMTSIDFGASIGRVVHLELRGEAFVTGGAELRPEWSQGLDELVSLLGEEPSSLRVSYVDTQTGEALATQRMRGLEHDIVGRWRAAGHRTALDIQTRVEAGR